MKWVFDGISRGLMATLMVASLLVPSVSFAAVSDEAPSTGEMVADALVVRPLMLVLTVAGTGLFVATLPFSLAGGNADEAASALVVGPAKTTFVRCLGCRQPVNPE